MSVTDLESRNNRILVAVIQAYTESAVPVGSESLNERFHLGVSAATIRNVMANLEEMGLITHPHTSAGRVPTDLGYRYYVDLLMEPGRLHPKEEEAIESLEENSSEEPEELLTAAAVILAELTHEAGLVLVPRLTQGSFRHLELIPMDGREVVGVLIASEGMVKHAIFELERPLPGTELERLVRFLNQELEGMPLSQILAYLQKSLVSGADFADLSQEVLELLSLDSLLNEEPELILEGANWVLEAPEFRDWQRTRRLVEALHRKRDLEEILRRDLSASAVKLHIGAENRGTSLTDCTIAAAPYRLSGDVMGAIGILGPTRMDYPKVTTLVGKMAQAVSRSFQS